MIPEFDHNHVIPPHIGDPRKSVDLSPYPCDTLEFCKKFATSHQRVEILRGLLEFRRRIHELGLMNGFQWLDGSFTENIEAREKRPPNDLDLVTFFRGLTDEIGEKLQQELPEFIDPKLAKKRLKLDHYPVDYGYNPEVTVEATRYWLQLFSHNRLAVWKGILRLELNTPEVDQQAVEYLNGLQL
jgi:hypothetical protein